MLLDDLGLSHPILHHVLPLQGCSHFSLPPTIPTVHEEEKDAIVGNNHLLCGCLYRVDRTAAVPLFPNRKELVRRMLIFLDDDRSRCYGWPLLIRVPKVNQRARENVPRR